MQCQCLQNKLCQYLIKHIRTLNRNAQIFTNAITIIYEALLISAVRSAVKPNAHRGLTAVFVRLILSGTVHADLLYTSCCDTVHFGKYIFLN